MSTGSRLSAPKGHRSIGARRHSATVLAMCAIALSLLCCAGLHAADVDRDTSNDCNDNGVPDDQDIAGGTSTDDNGNGLPDECEVRKNRYLTFASANSGPPVAYRIELTASEYFPDSTGVLGWIGEPDSDSVSRVVDAPFFSDAWPPYIFIGDCEIVPVATYALRATTNGVTFGDATTVATIARPVHAWPKPWGDVGGESDGMEWSPPDGFVNLHDIIAAIHSFQNRDPVPHWTRVDVDGQTPNATVNMSDLQRVVMAFSGGPYPFSDPANCP